MNTTKKESNVYLVLLQLKLARTFNCNIINYESKCLSYFISVASNNGLFY